MRTLTVDQARELGCPVENTDYFDGGEIIGLRFEPSKESLLSCEMCLAPILGVRIDINFELQENLLREITRASAAGGVTYSEWGLL